MTRFSTPIALSVLAGVAAAAGVSTAHPGHLDQRVYAYAAAGSAKVCVMRPGASCAGATLPFRVRHHGNLRGTNFRRADLRGVDFRGANLTGADPVHQPH